MGRAVFIIQKEKDMATLTEIRDNYMAILNTMSLNPQPSYSLKDRSFSFNEYQEMLLKQIAGLNEMINSMEPFEIRTRVIV